VVSNERLLAVKKGWHFVQEFHGTVLLVLLVSIRAAGAADGVG
jgi:hypothetical protein